MLWSTTTAAAPRKPRIERMFEMVETPALSSSSSEVRMVAAWVSEGPEVPSGWVGGWSCTVAFGRETVWPAGAPSGAVFSATVGAPAPTGVFKRIVGAGAGAVGAPAGRRAMVGAGAGRGAATLGAGGAEMPLGIGGFGATGAPGAAGGASDALRVTRTVSFFSGMDEVCLDAGIDEVARGAGIVEEGRGGGISFSLIAGRF